MDELLPFPRAKAAQGRRLGEVLAATPRVFMDRDPQRRGFAGTLRVGRSHARLRVVAGEWIVVWLPLDPATIAGAALGSSRELPACVRHVLEGRGRALLAETAVDGVLHLPESLAELGEGLRRAIARKPAAVVPVERPGDERVGEAVRGARAALALDPTDAVEVAGGRWELRPRAGALSVAVRVESEPGGVRLSHEVSRTRCEGLARAALETEVLRRNAAVRFCRLIATDGGLVVESRLRGALVTGEWIARAARRIAAAVHAHQAPLRVLAADPRVARTYAAVFPSRLEPTALATEEVKSC